MFSDFRYVVRALWRSRGFSLISILTLAVGIGAAAAIFSAADSILFRSNQFPEGVYLIGGQTDHTLMPVRFTYMARGYEQCQALEAVATATPMPGNIVVGGAEPVGINWIAVSPNLFPMLGVTPALGRGFLAGEDRIGSDTVAIISHRFWQQHFHGDRNALGRTFTAGDSICTVVGVLREGQELPMYFNGDVFRPLAYQVDPAMPWYPTLWTLGRVRPGITREQAREQLQALQFEVPLGAKEMMDREKIVLSTLSELNANYLRPDVHWAMIGAVGFLYAIACLNASNLLLTRMLGRRRELSIRLALGGGRWGAIRLLALESILIAVLGGLGGVLLANWLFPLLMAVTLQTPVNWAANWTAWSLSWRVLGVMGVLTVLTSLLIVIMPAVRLLRADIYAGLKDGGAALGESRGLARLRGGLVILQGAFAVILLCGAALMIRTFQQLGKVDLGFDPSDKVKVQLNIPPSYASDNDARLTRLREVQAVLQHVPGVRAVGFGPDILLQGYNFSGSEIVGPDGSPMKVNVTAFGQGFETAAGLTLKRGSWLTHRKGDDVLVNETLARKLWPDSDPVGQFVRTAQVSANTPKEWKGWQVVGVLGDVRSAIREPAAPAIYGPETWGPTGFQTFVVRLSRTYDEAFAGLIRRELYAFDPKLVVNQVVSARQSQANLAWTEHMAAAVLKILAGMAALLTLVGMFSVLAYSVDCRMTEFGIRMALGATRTNLVALVVRRGALLAVAGLVIGVGCALTLTRFLQSLLYQTSGQDPVVLTLVCLVLATTAAVACAAPAYRAAKVDVARLLRSE